MVKTKGGKREDEKISRETVPADKLKMRVVSNHPDKRGKITLIQRFCVRNTLNSLVVLDFVCHTLRWHTIDK